MVVVSDVDEIPRVEALLALKVCQGFPLDVGVTLVQKQYAYTFYYELTARSPWPGYTDWPGPVAADYQRFQALGPSGLRFQREQPQIMRLYDAGWHFSPFPFGSAERIIDKLSSWAHQEDHRKTAAYRSKERWETAMKDGHNCNKLEKPEDFEYLPMYVRVNKEKYNELLLN